MGTRWLDDVENPAWVRLAAVVEHTIDEIGDQVTDVVAGHT